MAIINLGILAHVDAGKTSLTERILFQTGVIAAVGSVDKGTTQTDSMELERARGITIRSTVVSFQLNSLKVNLIDTPGHADFVAEVERSLRVLDGVVLVVSAVEGVQPQTRRLARAVREAGLPLLIFVNKIDRLGARGEPLLEEIGCKLKLRIVAMNIATGLGARTALVETPDREDPVWRAGAADMLAETSDRVIAEFERTGGAPGAAFVERELRAQVAAGEVVPVFFGSAITGVGIPELLAGVEAWLPVADEATDGPVRGTVFKVARRPSGEKIVYARLVAGRLAVRDRVTTRRRDASGGMETGEGRLTGIERFVSGASVAVDAAGAGEIVALHGLRSARIGDVIGDPAGEDDAGDLELAPAFPAPALESVVDPVEPGEMTRLRAALEELAEQDPLISLRQRNDEGELSVRLYGDVQKEVLQDTLIREHGIAATFGPSRTICVERPVGTGEHAEWIGDAGNPFAATVGFRVAPAEPGCGVRYERELGSAPPAHYRAVEETVHETLAQGLLGWEVTDCVVTLTLVRYHPPASTAGDLRKLVPLVLTRALGLAGTAVCEPVEELELKVPEDTVGAVCGLLAGARAAIGEVSREGATSRVVCVVPTSEMRAVERRLPGLTRGDGGWSARPVGYVAVAGEPPERPRVGPDPRNRARYLAEVARG